MARCMLSDANLPKKYWGKVVSTRNYLQNRILTRAINRTPFESWNNRKRDIRNL